MQVMELKREVQLNPARRHLAQHARRDWIVDAEEGTTVEDILKPGYWAHVASEFTPFDHVEVRLETGEWVAELIVVNSGRNYANVHLIAKHELTLLEGVAEPKSSDHEVKWKGPHLKFCVIRKSDSAPVQQGMETKEAAYAWLANHEAVSRRA